MGGHRHRLSYPVRSSHLDSVRTVLIASHRHALRWCCRPANRYSWRGLLGPAALGSAGMISSRAVNLGEAGVRASIHVVLVWEWVPSNLLGERELLFRHTTPVWVSSMVVGRVASALACRWWWRRSRFHATRREANASRSPTGTAERTWPTNSWIWAGPVGEGPAVAAYASMASRSSASRRARRCSRWISAARWWISATFGRNVAAAIGGIATDCGVLDRQYAGAINAATICVCDTASNGTVPRGQSSAVSHVNAATGFGRLSPLRWRCPIRRPIRGPHAFCPRAHLP